MVDDDAPDPCVDNPPPGVIDRRLNDMAIVTLVLQQMTLLEARIGKKIDDNSRLVGNRWDHHDREHNSLGERIDSNYRLIKAMSDAQEKELVEFNARMEPVKSVVGIIRREWKTITIVAMVIVNMIVQVVDRSRVMP